MGSGYEAAALELERLRQENASLRLDRDSWEHKNRSDNEYLLGRLGNLEGAVKNLLAPGNVGGCREELKGGKCWKPAEFVLWGKLIPPEGLGPRCYDHAAKHVGHHALGNFAYAVLDLRPLRLAVAEPTTTASSAV